MTSFRSYFDSHRCEGCKEGVMVRGGDWDEQVLDCPEPCPREQDDDYVYEQFNDWLDNIETKLTNDDYYTMAASMDSIAKPKEYIAWYDIDKSHYSDISEAFYAWLDANKGIFTAKDYFKMGSAV